MPEFSWALLHPSELETSEQNIKNKIKDVYTELSEKAMAPHSSTLAWKIPWMEEPGRLQSMGS